MSKEGPGPINYSQKRSVGVKKKAPQGVQVPQDYQVPPQGVQVPIKGEGNEFLVGPPDMTNGEIIEVLLALARAMTTHVNKGVEPRVSSMESTMKSILRDFVRMNPHIFIVSKDEMNRFVTGVANLVKKECLTVMLHGDMSFSRLMVYAQSIEESKVSRISRNLERSGSSEKNQPRFKKRAPIKDEPRDPKVKLEKGSGSQNDKPTCATRGKKHCGKWLVGSRN
ncbi:hypothetical protein EJD97_007363 [Solanum chilense]|uniref:Uncharacterized protein n=1 Tax=Solanum chilense TaxID=4083 RepID=A0A6N2BP35_SOLCI|nr:hypothetical protein EJD97_007363 [Solanum chilense]